MKKIQEQKFAISHEMPLAYMHKLANLNDYHYALVHLFEKYPKYFEFFENCIQDGEIVILDNSLFELGTAFNNEKFDFWIKRLKPTYYIVPDVLHNMKETIYNAVQFKAKYSPEYATSTPIAVVQGNTLDEFIECYKKLAMDFDYLAFPATLPFYQELGMKSVHTQMPLSVTEYKAIGRYYAINNLHSAVSALYRFRRHHLLGCNSPIEYKFYSSAHKIISADTSNPVVLALQKMVYSADELHPLINKPGIKLVEFFETPFEAEVSSRISHNINVFRKYLKEESQK